PENLPQGSVRIKNIRINQFIIRYIIRSGGRRPVLANTAFRHPSGGKQAGIWMIYFRTPPGLAALFSAGFSQGYCF
ncbi:MAG: hypothetical protein LBJ60_03965, partial [Tannerellaceae bacterium]|nr:hypothetical protein [Tannerellaceae bacterium]